MENNVKVCWRSRAAVPANEILAKSMRLVVESAGLKFLVHEAVPVGDGGVSFGQAVVGGFQDS